MFGSRLDSGPRLRPVMYAEGAAVPISERATTVTVISSGQYDGFPLRLGDNPVFNPLVETEQIELFLEGPEPTGDVGLGRSASVISVVGAPRCFAAAVPALGDFGAALLGLALAGAGFLRLRWRRTPGRFRA